MNMKFALIMNDNSYPGREYAKVLKERNIDFDVINIGFYPIKNEAEEERCGGLWTPPLLTDILAENKIFRFESLKSQALCDFLDNRRYDVGIQGGTGILKNDVINRFRFGILNFHPGDLPEYRGCSAPEWQVFENRPVVCTCHLVDEQIDHGAIYQKQILNIDMSDYHIMRSQVYPSIAKFVADTLENLSENFVECCVPQNEDNARYRKYIGEEKINYLKQMMKKYTANMR